jgi:hypothetical protein
MARGVVASVMASRARGFQLQGHATLFRDVVHISEPAGAAIFTTFHEQ